jgi:hypothetical protein
MRQKLARYALLLLCIILANSMASCACKPEPVIKWSSTFDGGSGNSVQQTTDGGYIVCGTTGGDIWLIKTDNEGNKLWDKTYGGEETDWGCSVQQTTDGGYVVCGTTDGDIWLIKTDAEGKKLWDKIFPTGNEWWSGRCCSAEQTTEGGYIICGTTESYGAGEGDIWLIKTDAEGNKLWDKTYGGRDPDWGEAVQQTTDGGYIVCGGTYADYFDLWLIKTDADGNKLWDKTFGSGQFDVGFSVQQTKDGGYVICGTTGSLLGSNGDTWLIKTDAEGNKLWDKMFGCVGDGRGYSIQQTANGGYIMCGTTVFRFSGEILIGKQLFWIKTDAEGNKLWSKTLGGILKENAGGNSVRQTADGGYIVCGWIKHAGSSNVLLLKLSPER